VSRHAPAMQRGLAMPKPRQVCPHVPQFWTSFCRFKHARPQRLRPGSHEHVPAAQISASPHAMPQPPQSSGEVMVDTHVAAVPTPHVVPVHEHAPAVQVSPAAQRVAQLPHAVGSVAVFTQRPPHIVLPIGHVHTPETHESPTGHWVPHVPQ